MKSHRRTFGFTGSLLLVAILSSVSGCAIDWKVAFSEGTQNFIFSLLDPSRYIDTSATN